jgi:hypothetical protein
MKKEVTADFDLYKDVGHSLLAYTFLWLGKAHLGRKTDKDEIVKIVNEQLDRLRL